MVSFLKVNLKCIGRWSSKTAGTLFSLLTLLLAFVSWDDIGVVAKCDRLFLLVVIIIFSILVAIFILLFKRSNVLWEKGNGKIRVMYGDILKVAFPPKCKENRIVVIPVNTCFDTIVGNGLVSENTIHGKWLEGMVKRGVSITELDKKITQSIKALNLNTLERYSEAQKPKGKLERFPQGTIISIEGEYGLEYYLLALSEFDENLNAQCTKEEFVNCIQDLMTFYDKNGQGRPIYLPLMGTGLSRVNISPEESLNILTNMIMLNRNKVHGVVNIIVFDKQRNAVSIFNV